MSQPNKPQVLAIHRLGNVQAVIEMRGEGILAAPHVRFVKVLPREVLESAPEMATIYQMQEVAALKTLCERLLQDSIDLQTLVPRPPAPPVIEENKPSDEAKAVTP